jgi:hypothetical protein
MLKGFFELFVIKFLQMSVADTSLSSGIHYHILARLCALHFIVFCIPFINRIWVSLYLCVLCCIFIHISFHSQYNLGHHH